MHNMHVSMHVNMQRRTDLLTSLTCNHFPLFSKGYLTHLIYFALNGRQ